MHGPNGYLREFQGPSGQAAGDIEATLRYDPDRQLVTIRVTNRSAQARAISVHDNAYGAGALPALSEQGNTNGVREWAVAQSGNWYDLTISDGRWSRRFAGRLETGTAGVSDPAMGTLPEAPRSA